MVLLLRSYHHDCLNEHTHARLFYHGHDGRFMVGEGRCGKATWRDLRSQPTLSPSHLRPRGTSGAASSGWIGRRTIPSTCWCVAFAGSSGASPADGDLPVRMSSTSAFLAFSRLSSIFFLQNTYSFRSELLLPLLPIFPIHGYIAVFPLGARAAEEANGDSCGDKDSLNEPPSS